jgi:hypothetical protein
MSIHFRAVEKMVDKPSVGLSGVFPTLRSTICDWASTLAECIESLVPYNHINLLGPET